jgi:hypothetical protein
MNDPHWPKADRQDRGSLDRGYPINKANRLTAMAVKRQALPRSSRHSPSFFCATRSE